jgi:hypothetical protein
MAGENLAAVKTQTSVLKAEGFQSRLWENDEQLLFACGDYSKPDITQTHFILVAQTGSAVFQDYINFREYLNSRPWPPKTMKNKNQTDQQKSRRQRKVSR